MAANIRVLQAAAVVSDFGQLAGAVRAARGDDDLVCIGVDDQVRVMRNDDDLPAQLGMAEESDQLVENRFGIEILFGLVDDQRPVVIARGPVFDARK